MKEDNGAGTIISRNCHNIKEHTSKRINQLTIWRIKLTLVIFKHLSSYLTESTPRLRNKELPSSAVREISAVYSENPKIIL
jgi:hypothetical protein